MSSFFITFAHNLFQMTLAQRIKNLRKELGLNQTEFAQRIGITQTSLSQIEGEKNGISYDVYKAIVNEFAVDPTWLMDGIGNMLRSPDLGSARSDKLGALPLVVQIDSDQEENIVVVDKKAAAGYLQHQQDPEFIAKLPSFRLPGYHGKTFRAFEIIGDSMIPGITPGDMIVGSYVESLNEIKNGSVYIVVTHDGSIVAKRVTSLGNDLYELKSDNTVYEAYAVKADDIAQVWKAESRITREFEKASGENVRMSSMEQRLLDLERKLSNS
ncbi:MAG TPA: helix-turn-helix domain-containing protein [Bacteroidia bacterium]|nr:helix-turn-helix domain-containing protein [Bacteroidia bacterium]